MPGDSEPLGFVKESPLRTIRRYAEEEIYGTVTPAGIKALNDSPLLWLRALVQIESEVNNHIAKDKASTAKLKPPAGTDPSPEYLQAKIAVDGRSTSRLHFQQKVKSRIDDVKAILGPDPINRIMVGDLIEVFEWIRHGVTQDDLDGVAQRANHWSCRLAGVDTRKADSKKKTS